MVQQQEWAHQQSLNHVSIHLRQEKDVRSSLLLMGFSMAARSLLLMGFSMAANDIHTSLV